MDIRAANGHADANGAVNSHANRDTLPAANAVLGLAPAIATAERGGTFAVEIRIRTAQLVDGAAAHIDFNPAILQVASITPGSALPTVLQNQTDNLLGRSDSWRCLSAPFPTSNFVLATVVFTATELTSGTPITFVSANPRQSVVTYDGNAILKHVENGTVIVREGFWWAGSRLPDALPHRTSPGASRSPSPSSACPTGATVEIAPAPPRDASGYFTLTGLSGAYQIPGVRGHNTLRTTAVDDE